MAHPHRGNGASRVGKPHPHRGNHGTRRHHTAKRAFGLHHPHRGSHAARPGGHHKHARKGSGNSHPA